MIGRRFSRKADTTEQSNPRWFDDFDVRLGDMMRGERATLGKSLLDVQRELRIKASYIAAIENSDPSAFDTPGFIAGYVRSYARYLGMDPERAYEIFCQESGFSVAHGMSEKASVVKKQRGGQEGYANGDALSMGRSPFAGQADESIFANMEPRAIGSMLVLLAIIFGLIYGGWSVLREVQRVQVDPVEQAPVVLSDLDPLEGVTRRVDETGEARGPSAEALDRLYRPQALDVPILVPRDEPIATIDPRTVGSFLPPQIDTQARDVVEIAQPAPVVPQVVEAPRQGVTVIAVRQAWIRITSADGTSIFEKIMERGETYEVPQTQDPAQLRVGESGAIYFVVNGETYGPAGPDGQVSSGVVLSTEQLVARYEPANPEQDQEINRLIVQNAATGDRVDE